uniref:Uncharacterized protein n=1 Tax=Arundo donax TaxID=35708 RepID=A0A0A9GAG7_ARUDO
MAQRNYFHLILLIGLLLPTTMSLSRASTVLEYM